MARPELRFAVAFGAISALLLGLYAFPYQELGLSEGWFNGYLADARLVGTVLGVVEPAGAPSFLAAAARSGQNDGAFSARPQSARREQAEYGRHHEVIAILTEKQTVRERRRGEQPEQVATCGAERRATR